MNAVGFSKPDLFFAAGVTIATLAISGTSIPVMGAYDDAAFRPTASNHGNLSNVPSVVAPDPAPQVPARANAESVADLVKQIKSRGSYTWDQVAKLLGVSRRTVHLWSSGGRISAANEEALGQVMKQIDAIEETDGNGTRLQFLELLDQQRAQSASAPTDVNRPAPTYASGQ